MAGSKSASSRQLKIKILLGIDTVFFLIELISGLAIGSLALLSDSFHMLNDVCSLVVALQALKLAETNSASSRYSYGWQRAEVLGALINGVFLLALCFTVGLEAIARLFGDVEVTNPVLMVAVGSAGLLSNIIGLFLFHDHGHSHGGHSHSHGGHSHSHAEPDLEAASHSHSHDERSPLLSKSKSNTPPSSSDSTQVPSEEEHHHHSDEEEEEREEELEEELFVHPGEFRGNIVKQAHEAGYGTTAHSHEGHEHGDHSHAAEEGGHGHSHAEGSMNMRGVFLHVLGDALGNVGVIVAGLFIWLTNYGWRMYTDPVVSLIITCIIFSSALPLVKSASFILLQGVPNSVPLDKVRSEIAALPGVINVHELHIWSLSESKTVCSVHVMTKSGEFIAVSESIRKVLHKYGVHSSTIQPEIVESKTSKLPSHISTAELGTIQADQDGCLVSCIDDSCREQACCPTPKEPNSPTTEEGHEGHSH